ncbi:MAG: hypothetical protein J3K34DRAFT_421819 [Monoraphidium minutum]|nr:MAG: hypothetical protein J3K34DRAFT_421819 [Monoraphidium minutum]
MNAIASSSVLNISESDARRAAARGDRPPLGKPHAGGRLTSPASSSRCLLARTRCSMASDLALQRPVRISHTRSLARRLAARSMAPPPPETVLLVLLPSNAVAYIEAPDTTWSRLAAMPPKYPPPPGRIPLTPNGLRCLVLVQPAEGSSTEPGGLWRTRDGLSPEAKKLAERMLSDLANTVCLAVSANGLKPWPEGLDHPHDHIGDGRRQEGVFALRTAVEENRPFAMDAKDWDLIRKDVWHMLMPVYFVWAVMDGDNGAHAFNTWRQVRGGAPSPNFKEDSFLLDHVGVVANAAYNEALLAGSTALMVQLEAAARVLPPDWATKGFMRVNATERKNQLQAAAGMWPQTAAGGFRSVDLPRCCDGCPSVLLIVLVFKEIIYIIVICLTILLAILFPPSFPGSIPIVPVWPQSTTTHSPWGASVGVSYHGLVVPGRTHPNPKCKSLLAGAPGNEAGAPQRPEAINTDDTGDGA